MSTEEIDEFLSAPRHAIVGTNRKEGPPQLTPVWYLYEDGKLYFSIYTASAKYKNLKRDSRIAVCIAGDRHDARSVMLYGSVELVIEGSDWTRDMNYRLARRYFDSDEALKSYQEAADGGGVGALAVLTPNRILAQDYN
jgi:PPOX class probable F420-dependent enzyme